MLYGQELDIDKSPFLNNMQSVQDKRALSQLKPFTRAPPKQNANINVDDVRKQKYYSPKQIK